jgi:hypothetical protein
LDIAKEPGRRRSFSRRRQNLLNCLPYDFGGGKTDALQALDESRQRLIPALLSALGDVGRII